MTNYAASFLVPVLSALQHVLWGTTMPNDSFELERAAARLREIERHPELLTGGPCEWDRRH